MSVLVTEVRAGTYADSIVLMQLQSDLQRLDGVLTAGVVMGEAVNLELLRASGLLHPASEEARPEDLVIAVRADSEAQAAAALAQVDHLLRSRQSADSEDYRPRSLATALRQTPEAQWVVISVPGRHAGRLADEALDGGCHVFLYSDNVSLQDELRLKTKASQRGTLLLGPDCGSAIIGGVGLGFFNVARSGSIGLVCASGTGLQAISSRIHQMGAGISHAIGLGGRDLSADIRGSTARLALDLLARDEATEVIVIASKPIDEEVGASLLLQGLEIEKPVVIYFAGFSPPAPRLGGLHFARSLSEAASTAVDLTQSAVPGESSRLEDRPRGGHLRGLFAGGTLALEAVQVSKHLLRPLHTNLNVEGTSRLADPTLSRGHTVLDLGSDEYTKGRLHPMMDQRLRLERLAREAADPQTGLIVLDLILGRGADHDPLAEMEPALAAIRDRQGPPVLALVVGTDEDPQDLGETTTRLTEVGAMVYTDVSRGLAEAIRFCAPPAPVLQNRVDLQALLSPEAIINVGLESFREDLAAQGVPSVQVDWRPPAGGNERLMAILEKMKR